MFKAPVRSKQRLRASIGDAAAAVAEHLLDCALEDLAGWDGPTCLAAAAEDDAAWIRRQHATADVVVQGTGNLGERIERVNQQLLDQGHARQIFLGSDCPGLDGAYLAAADRALASHDVVLGPAADGGVVLMGVAGRWPALATAPWSTSSLLAALIERCERSGLGVALLERRADVDAPADLEALAPTLARDARPARRALLRWLQSRAGGAQ